MNDSASQDQTRAEAGGGAFTAMSHANCNKRDDSENEASHCADIGASLPADMDRFNYEAFW